MPLYEYTCRACDHRFEVLQPLGAGSEDLTCEACGDPRVARCHSTFAAASGRATAAPAPAGGCCLGTAA